MVTGQKRGHQICFMNDQWVYADNHHAIVEERPCKRCVRFHTKEGYDACLGYIKGVTSACCGHGVEPPYVVYNDDYEE